MQLWMLRKLRIFYASLFIQSTSKYDTHTHTKKEDHCSHLTAGENKAGVVK